MEGAPTNQLIIKLEGAHADVQHDIRARLERAGQVLFLKTYTELLRTVAIFDSTEESMAAKRSLEDAGYEVHYGLGADRETVLKFHLAPPPEERMFLLSPPPSPPEGWKPLYEGINSIPHFNVALSVEPGDNVLLKGDKRRGMPAITLDDWEHSGGDDNAQRAGGDNTLFVMDE